MALIPPWQQDQFHAMQGSDILDTATACRNHDVPAGVPVHPYFASLV